MTGPTGTGPGLSGHRSSSNTNQTSNQCCLDGGNRTDWSAKFNDTPCHEFRRVGTSEAVAGNVEVGARILPASHWPAFLKLRHPSQSGRGCSLEMNGSYCGGGSSFRNSLISGSRGGFFLEVDWSLTGREWALPFRRTTGKASGSG